MIAGFADHIYYVNSSWEYLKIHYRNIQMLSRLSEERGSNHIQDKIKQYPEVTQNEIDSYISDKKGENIQGGPWQRHLVKIIFELIFNKGKTSSQAIKDKVFKIKSINLHMVKIVENPLLEKLYLEKAVG